MDKFSQAVLSLVVAAGLWILVFLIRPVNFWIMMSVSTLTLMLLTIFINREPPRLKPRARDIILGLLSGVALYAAFYIGFQATQTIPLFGEGVIRVYNFRSGMTPLTIGLLLIFPIAPAEEVYWRGLIQRRFVERIGKNEGFLLAAVAYALVHVPTLNLPLVMTALVGGLAWGYLYRITSGLVSVIMSHTVFDLLIFVVAPLA